MKYAYCDDIVLFRALSRGGCQF